MSRLYNLLRQTGSLLRKTVLLFPFLFLLCCGDSRNSLAVRNAVNMRPPQKTFDPKPVGTNTMPPWSFCFNNYREMVLFMEKQKVVKLHWFTEWSKEYNDVLTGPLLPGGSESVIHMDVSEQTDNKKFWPEADLKYGVLKCIGAVESFDKRNKVYLESRFAVEAAVKKTGTAGETQGIIFRSVDFPFADRFSIKGESNACANVIEFNLSSDNITANEQTTFQIFAIERHNILIFNDGTRITVPCWPQVNEGDKMGDGQKVERSLFANTIYTINYTIILSGTGFYIDSKTGKLTGKLVFAYNLAGSEITG